MDMEWNQALTYSEMVKDPVFLTGEIIQIGAIKLNQTLEVVDSFNERIAPQYYTELHPKVAEITKLSNRDLQKGKGFHTVFNTRFDCEGITMLKLFDIVTLKNDDPETGVKAGTEGTIVDILGNGKAFTVEFFDEDGNTIEASLYTEYTPAQLQKVETALTLT